MSAQASFLLAIRNIPKYVIPKYNINLYDLSTFNFVFARTTDQTERQGWGPRGASSSYIRILDDWKRITIFLYFSCKPYNAIEKLLAGLNVQPVICMNQSLIWLHYHATLLMTSHGYKQHPAPFCTFSWSVLIIFMFKLWHVWYHITKRVYRLFSN